MSFDAVRERYNPRNMAANSSLISTNQSLGGFIPVTSGTITVTSYAGNVIVNACPVTAGFYLPLPMFVGTNGCTIQLAGGASGTMLI